MKQQSKKPRVSIIIPSWTGEVTRVMQSIERQTFRDYEVDVVRGISPAARARNVAAARAAGDILLFIDDDAYFGHAGVLQSLVDVLDSDPQIAVVGTSKLVPQTASRLQKLMANQVPRMVYPVVPSRTESNPPLHGYGFTAVTTTCCAVRRSVYEEVGGFDENLTTGPEDTDFFYRVRSVGYQINVASNSWVYHDPPASIKDLMRKSFWYGVGHALEARKNPERKMEVLPLNRWYGKLAALGIFLALPVSFFIHFYFDPIRRLEIGFRPLKTLSTYSVLAGYIMGWYRGKPKKAATTYMGRPAAATLEVVSPEQAKVKRPIGNGDVEVGSQLVSIIVPSWSGEVARLMESIKKQTYKNYEVEIVKGVSPIGRARNIGVKNTSGDILLFVDDDAYFGTDDVIEKLVRTITADPSVGVAGTSKIISGDASKLQRAIARQVPRMVYPVLSETLESNPPLQEYGYSALSTTCCAVLRSVFYEAGGFDEKLTRSGEDTDFFYKVHSNGWRMMIAGNCWVYHDPPASIKDLMRKSFWYGVGHAAEARKSPDRGMAIIPLDKWYGKLALPAALLAFLPALFVHVYFDPAIEIAFGFRPMKTLSTYAVLCGYVYGWYNSQVSKPVTTYMGRKRAAGAEDA